MQQTNVTSTALSFTDYEGNEVAVNLNGDAAQYGAFLEVAANTTTGATAATAHMTPEQMADLGRWLLEKSGLL